MTELVTLQTIPEALTVEARLTVVEVHRLYGAFVQRALHRLGVRPPHLEDVYQEVFLVVHRRLPTFVGRSTVTTWLFEICFRVVAGYRRRAHFKREQLGVDDYSLSKIAVSTLTPEREVEKRQAAARVEAALARVNINQRVVFTLFEIQGLTCEQISAQLGVPTGTVYSRLHRGRKAFLRNVNRQDEHRTQG